MWEMWRFRSFFFFLLFLTNQTNFLRECKYIFLFFYLFPIIAICTTEKFCYRFAVNDLTPCIVSTFPAKKSWLYIFLQTPHGAILQVQVCGTFQFEAVECSHVTNKEPRILRHSHIFHITYTTLLLLEWIIILCNNLKILFVCESVSVVPSMVLAGGKTGMDGYVIWCSDK